MIRAALVGPWAIAGDFNLIAEARDKNNDRVNRRSMALFRRFINGLELKEAHLIGRRYTWSNERDCPTLEKLDRWLCSIEWDEMHPDAVLVARSSLLSDHCPVLMSTAMYFVSKSHLRFERFWVKLDGFQDTVAESWSALGAPPEPIRRLGFKLRRVATDLQRWSSRRVGSIHDQLLVANEVIHQLDIAQESRQLTPLELALRRDLKRRILGLASLERTIAR
jgi:hypothetical protein